MGEWQKIMRVRLRGKTGKRNVEGKPRLGRRMGRGNKGVQGSRGGRRRDSFQYNKILGPLPIRTSN
jgi:hypothetical protein